MICIMALRILYWVLEALACLLLKKTEIFNFGPKKLPPFMRWTFLMGQMCKNLLSKNVFLSFRNYIYTFPLSNSLLVGPCTFNWILHISLHRSGPLKEKLVFWNHPFLNFLMPFLAGRLLSAPNAFKNCFESVPFGRKLNFWDISSSSDFRPWRNKKWLKKLLFDVLKKANIILFIFLD